MKSFYRICLLPLVTVLASSHCAAQDAPSALPNQPDTLVHALYSQVVTRHPFGIPYGEDMTVFAPYISKTLLHRFDLTRACFADWSRQNPDPDLKPPSTWIEDGLFSGSSEEAAPKAFSIEKTELESDGSTRVRVKLTWGSAPEEPLIWYVVAVVVHEGDRPVVDDVLFLKDDDHEIGYRLSEALAAGCDGPRWVDISY